MSKLHDLNLILPCYDLTAAIAFTIQELSTACDHEFGIMDEDVEDCLTSKIEASIYYGPLAQLFLQKQAALM